MTQVKICGITNQEDALVAAQGGASALGFIFYPPSPRYITPADARKITSALPSGIITVGVFVNEKPENINKVLDVCALDMIQLHGDETPEYCRQFRVSGVIKAVELKNKDDVHNALGYPAVILADNREGNLYGGTGKTSRWELAALLNKKKPLILSGGLNVTNIAEAIKAVKPAALDINSGVESAPGKKDHRTLSQILDVIRASGTMSENLQKIFKKREI